MNGNPTGMALGGMLDSLAQVLLDAEAQDGLEPKWLAARTMEAVGE